MLRPLFIALTCVVTLGACASTSVRYVDAAGKEHPGTVDALTNTITAQIGGTAYRGPYRANEWGQARSTLMSARGERLYCDFIHDVLKIKGTCTDLSGGDYRLLSR